MPLQGTFPVYIDLRTSQIRKVQTLYTFDLCEDKKTWQFTVQVIYHDHETMYVDLRPMISDLDDFPAS